MKSENHYIPVFDDYVLCVKREDLLHPFVSGNKYRKLKYNLQEAIDKGMKGLLTFGGAFSNHIAALAFAGQERGLKTIGIIRGEELEGNYDDNPTLQFARSCGMELIFVSREEYRLKEKGTKVINLINDDTTLCLIPEGGTNILAVKGCEEILNNEDKEFDYIVCSAGTGGTVSGLINSSFDHQRVIGFSVLKGDFLKKDICKFAKNDRWELDAEYHFGGYGKVTAELIRFMNSFHNDTGILLDPVYTGKMFFGVFDKIKKGFFPKGSRILLIHTGGLQGIAGMNLKLEHKKLPKIEFHV